MALRLCRSCADFHDLAQPWPVDCASHFGEQTGAGFHIISDTMAPIRSMADGKMYDSKSVYRSDLKARGLVEVGNDRTQRAPVQAPPVRQHMRDAIRQLGG